MDRTECFCQEDKSIGFQRVLCPNEERWSVQFDAYPQCDANGETFAISEDQYDKCKGFLDDVQDGCGACPCFNGSPENPVFPRTCACNGQNNGDFPPPDPFNPTPSGVTATCGGTQSFELKGQTDEDGNLSDDAFCSCDPLVSERCLTPPLLQRELSETEFMACYAQLDPLCSVATSCPCFSSTDLQSAFDTNTGSSCFTQADQDSQFWLLNTPNPNEQYGVVVSETNGFFCIQPGEAGDDPISTPTSGIEYNLCRDLLFTFAAENTDCIACPCFDGDLPADCADSAMCMNDGPIEDNEGDYGVNLMCDGQEYGVAATVDFGGDIDSSMCTCSVGSPGCVATSVPGLSSAEANACYDLLSPTCPPTQAPTVMDEECPCFTLVEVETADLNGQCQCISDEDGARLNCINGVGLDPAFAAFSIKDTGDLACRTFFEFGTLIFEFGITQQQYDICVSHIEAIINAPSGQCNERACPCFDNVAPACVPEDNIFCDIGGPFGCDVPPESSLGVDLTCERGDAVDLEYSVFGEPNNINTGGSCSCPGDAVGCFASQVDDSLIPVDFNACFDVLNANCPVTSAPTTMPTTDECPCMDGYKQAKEAFKANMPAFENNCVCNDDNGSFVSSCLPNMGFDIDIIELAASRGDDGRCSFSGPGIPSESLEMIGELAADACIRFLAETSSLFCDDITWSIDLNPIRN